MDEVLRLHADIETYYITMINWGKCRMALFEDEIVIDIVNETNALIKIGMWMHLGTHKFETTPDGLSNSEL